ncbi:energy transducer TonB [Novosphingobium sp. PS1R-30]|uniref:Energy transducer TonB n=1 Tax=Novosphingobium anseongense TaxID=3133436 RepID=A0ABU8RWF7_9SPHN
MSAWLSIVLAGAAVSPATPVEPNTWFNSKDNPKTAMRVAERGHVTYTIDVAADGTPLRCTPDEKSDLDHDVCALVMKRARFLPAKDDQGRAVAGTYEAVASFLMPGKQRSRPDRSKLAVAVNSLPEGVTGPAFARVAFLVDGTGTVSQCTPLAAERRRFQQTVPALGPAACESLTRDYHPSPVTDATGAAVASVQSATVRFEFR